MYVCICNSLREKEIHSAIARGACSVGDAFGELGCKPMCGQCVPMIQETIEIAQQIR